MYRSLCVLSVVLILGGCGKHGKNDYETKAGKADMAQSKAPMKIVVIDDSGSMNIADKIAQPIDRKIIYTALISLVVKNFSVFEDKLDPLVKQYKGRRDHFHSDRTQGERRSGNWTIRIPVADFDAFLDELDELGFPESKQIDADDVTRHYYDVKSRLKTDRAVEKRFLDIIDKRTGKIEDVLKAEIELHRVRGDIESKETKLKNLNHLTSYSTVKIKARQDKEYVAPQAPIFGEQITATWNGSLKGLQTFGKNAVLTVVGAAPWLAILAIVITPPVWLTKRRIRRRRETTT